MLRGRPVIWLFSAHLAHQLLAEELPALPCEGLVTGGAIPLALEEGSQVRWVQQQVVQRTPSPGSPRTSLGAIRDDRVILFSAGTVPGLAPPTIVSVSPESTEETVPLSHDMVDACTEKGQARRGPCRKETHRRRATES